MSFPASPKFIFKSLFDNRSLLWALVKRDFIGRYKGSFFGVVWSLFNPLMMLAIYTFVFGVAFKSRWGIGADSKVDFAIILFAGIIVSNLFAECINRSPSLIISNPSYVKKVVFPLEILPWMSLFSALLHFLVSFLVLILFCFLSGIVVYTGFLMIPIIITPLILMIMGFSWIFASLGVYFRDLSQAMGMITTITLFLAPIFYPIESLPKSYQSFMALNPITLPVLQLRDCMLWGKSINWESWLVSLMLGLILFQLGYWWFQKTRQGFADVI